MVVAELPHGAERVLRGPGLIPAAYGYPYCAYRRRADRGLSFLVASTAANITTGPSPQPRKLNSCFEVAPSKLGGLRGPVANRFGQLNPVPPDCPATAGVACGPPR